MAKIIDKASVLYIAENEIKKMKDKYGEEKVCVYARQLHEFVTASEKNFDMYYDVFVYRGASLDWYDDLKIYDLYKEVSSFSSSGFEDVVVLTDMGDVWANIGIELRRWRGAFPVKECILAPIIPRVAAREHTTRLGVLIDIWQCYSFAEGCCWRGLQEKYVEEYFANYVVHADRDKGEYRLAHDLKARIVTNFR